MQLLPSGEHGNSKVLSIGLLVIPLILFYTLFHYVFVVDYLDLGKQKNEQLTRYSKYLTTLQQRAVLESGIEELRERQQETDFFLNKANFNLAAAELQRKLKQLVTANAVDSDTCQIVSQQNVKPKDEERFEKVTVKVRMRCSLEEFQPIVYALEAATPLLMIDNVNIYQQQRRRSRSRGRGKKAKKQTSYLDIRFELIGYLRSAQEVTK